MKTLVKNGMIVSPEDTYEADEKIIMWLMDDLYGNYRDCNYAANCTGKNSQWK